MSHSRKSCSLQMKRQKEFSAAASSRGKKEVEQDLIFSWFYSLAQESEALGYGAVLSLFFWKVSSNQVAKVWSTRYTRTMNYYFCWFWDN